MVTPLGIHGNSRYRTVEEARTISWLLLNGWACDLAVGDEDSLRRTAAATLNRWVRIGLPFEESPSGGRLFDPAEVLNFSVFQGSRHGDPFWRDCYIATGRRLVLAQHGIDAADVAPPSPASLRPQKFVVTHLREFNLESYRRGSRVHLRAPVALADETLRDITVDPIVDSDLQADVTIAPGRLDVTCAVPERRLVTLGVKASFTAYPTLPGGPSAPLPDSDIEIYTRPREGVVCVSTKIRKLADELAADLKPSPSVQCFWNFIIDRLMCGVLHYDEINSAVPTDWVLETGWFDCHMGSALLVALCRARGIPARMISGFLLFAASPTYHYWAEVWTAEAGWIPLDVICAGLSCSGRDKRWRDYFAGQLDYRMKTQCLPRLFDTTAAVRLPKSWYLLTRPIDGGAETGIFDTESGAFVYRDWVKVHRVS